MDGDVPKPASVQVGLYISTACLVFSITNSIMVEENVSCHEVVAVVQCLMFPCSFLVFVFGVVGRVEGGDAEREGWGMNDGGRSGGGGGGGGGGRDSDWSGVRSGWARGGG